MLIQTVHFFNVTELGPLVEALIAQLRTQNLSTYTRPQRLITEKKKIQKRKEKEKR